MDLRIGLVVWVAAAVACGPAVSDDDGGDDAGGTAESSGGGTGVGPTTGAGPSTGAGPEVTSDVTSNETSSFDLGGPRASFDGVYLLAVSAVISPETPLQWLASVSEESGPSGATLRIELQSLSLDVGSTNAPRELIGDPVDVVVGIDDSGSFGVELPSVRIVGAANPITGGDLVASIVLEGSANAPDDWCGQAFGQVTEPLMLDLTGSTFAFTPVFDALPDPVVSSCAP